MKVFAFRKDYLGQMELESTLEAEQKFVGGLIEVVAIAPGLDLVCNEEGRINSMEPRAVLMDGNDLVDIICGDCFVCRSNEEGEFVSIKDSDVKTIKERVKYIVAVHGSHVYIEE